MKEKDIRLEVSHALQWYGYWPYHHQDGRNHVFFCSYCRRKNFQLITPEIKGRPDLEARHPLHPTIFIEVKSIRKEENSFRMDKIRIEQVDYLDRWCKLGGQAYFAIGKIVPMGTKTKIHSIMVIPWDVFRERTIAIDITTPIPYDWELYKNKPSIRMTSLVEVFPEDKYHMWKTQTGWQLSSGHPIGGISELVETPYFLQKGEAQEDEVREQVQESEED